MKKFLAFLVALVAAISMCVLFAGCPSNDTSTGDNGEVSAVVGIYQWHSTEKDGEIIYSYTDFGASKNYFKFNADGTGEMETIDDLYEEEITSNLVSITWTLDGDEITISVTNDGVTAEQNMTIDGDCIYIEMQGVKTIYKKILNSTIIDETLFVGTYKLYAYIRYWNSNDREIYNGEDEYYITFNADGSGEWKEKYAPDRPVDHPVITQSLKWTLDGNEWTLYKNKINVKEATESGNYIEDNIGYTIKYDFEGALLYLDRVDSSIEIFKKIS